jgi:hypothetical protein
MELNFLFASPAVAARYRNCYQGLVSDPLIRKVVDAMVAPVKGGESLASLGCVWRQQFAQHTTPPA